MTSEEGQREVDTHAVTTSPSRPADLPPVGWVWPGDSNRTNSPFPVYQDEFNLERFRTAQDDSSSWLGAMSELRKGRKTGHWIWYVFPQPPFGESPASQFFAIRSRREAEIYLLQRHLGSRAVIPAKILKTSPAATLKKLMPEAMVVDRRKLHSSMTLFYRVAYDLRGRINDADAENFKCVLDRYYGGKEDEQTVTWLEKEAGAEKETEQEAEKEAVEKAETKEEKEEKDVEKDTCISLT